MPEDHAVREIAAVLDLSWAHSELAPYYPEIGRPSIDPVLMIRMLIVGYVFGIRSERALCREVQVNLAYRWFCGLSIEDKVPDHSAFYAHATSALATAMFSAVCSSVSSGRVSLPASSVVRALRSMRASSKPMPTSTARSGGAKWHKDIDPEQAFRAVKEYLATLDAPAYGAASDVTPKFVSPSDPAAQWTGALRNAAFFAYANNYLVDVKFGIIMDVEASRAIRQAEIGAAQTMIERTKLASASGPNGSRRTAPMVRPPTSIGWPMSRGSRRMSQSSTNRSVRTARSRARTSTTTRYATSIHVRRAGRSPRLAISTPITRCGISAPGLSVARARSKRSAARTCPRDGSSAM